jgi:hypothetical protein
MNPNSDFKDLLSVFNDFDVRYLIVGGYALMLYAEPRFTKDLDIWVEASDLNASRVFAALAQFGAPLKGLSPADFAQTGIVYQIGMPPARIDILMSVTGVDFPSAWENRKMTTYAGLAAPCISRADLIKNKRATGRPQDLLDAEQLERG